VPEGPALLLGGPRSAVLPLAQAEGPRRLWSSAEGIAIATDGPRVVGTAGLGPMLLANRPEGPDPLADPLALDGREARQRRVLDLSGPDRDPATMRFGVVLNCTLAGRADGAALLVEERCAGERIGFANRYWVDRGTGAVTRSEQWGGEEMPMLRITLSGV
jgi:hypothetical protein